jgi:hypothetical protein
VRAHAPVELGDSEAIDLFLREDARDALHASYRQALKPINGVRYTRLSTGGPIGHESRMYTGRTKSGGTSLVVYLIAWRYFTVKAATIGRASPGP